MTQFKKREETTLRITDYAYGGKGIAKIQTEGGFFVVFVPNTIPGQQVRVRMEKTHRKYAEARLLEVVEPSPDEQPHSYQPIPGAPYATLPIALQQAYKRKAVHKLFAQIGGIQNSAELERSFIASPRVWHYRNKMEYAFSEIRFDLAEQRERDDFALGFKHRGTWWVVENLDADSGLLDAEGENKLHEVRKWCERSGLPAWHPPKAQGFYRYLTVRKSFVCDQLLYQLVTSSEGLERFDAQGFATFMQTLYGPRLAGVLHSINDDTGDRVQPLSGEPHLLWGKPTISERICGIDFEISMQSFFQTNPASAEKLYTQVVEEVRQHTTREGLIIDLFCGTGTITQLIAQAFPDREVIGIDLVEEAIADAEANARRNGITNTRFIAGDAGLILREHPEYQGKPATVVLDPPRGGIAPKTLQRVIGLGAQTLVYVSCNPATQARDFAALREGGYSLLYYHLCDQFPHTAHIESIAVLKLKS